MGGLAPALLTLTVRLAGALFELEQPPGVVVPVVDRVALIGSIEVAGADQSAHEVAWISLPLRGPGDRSVGCPQGSVGCAVERPEPQADQMPRHLNGRDAQLVGDGERLPVMRDRLMELDPSHQRASTGVMSADRTAWSAAIAAVAAVGVLPTPARRSSALPRVARYGPVSVRRVT